jgi:ubiquinone/menaquinone biosynthesis C-methylase UbiE
MSLETRSVRHAYDQVADEYAKKFVHELATNAFDRSVIDDAFNSHRSGGVVMDLGCGPGQVASYLADRGNHTIGLDLTPAMLTVAQQAHPALPLVGGDVFALPIRSGALDGIVAWYVLHNLQRASLPAALSEIRRVLRADGLLLIATHGGVGEEVVEHVWMGCEEHVVVTCFQADELSGVLTQNGFRVEAIRQRGPLEYEWQATKLYAVARKKADHNPKGVR